MYPPDLLFCILLISIGGFSTASSAVVQSRRPQPSPEATSDLKDVPDKWKAVNSELRAPQVEIHLTKDEVSREEIWTFIDEQKHPGGNHGIPMEAKSTVGEKKISVQTRSDVMKTTESKNEVGDNASDSNVTSNKTVPFIGSRNIITEPTFCPEGQRKDRTGRCRLFLE